MHENGPLQGCRVLELGSTVAGPYCGRLLADFGAEVIKVESPDGDPVRTFGDSFEGKSLYWASLSRNKRVMSIDLRGEKGRDLVRQLIAKSDVLVENFRPGTMEKWGLGYAEVLVERFPRLVHCRISGFGADGPYGGFPGYFPGYGGPGFGGPGYGGPGYGGTPGGGPGVAPLPGYGPGYGRPDAGYLDPDATDGYRDPRPRTPDSEFFNRGFAPPVEHHHGEEETT